MRYLIPTILVAAIVVSLVTTAGADGPVSFSEARGCDHQHRSEVAYKRIRLLLNNHNPGVKKAQVHHYAVCVATRAKSHHAHEVARKWWKWRHSYGPLWEIRRNTLDGWIVSRPASLRWCESRGNYAIDTHHDGAYQYLPSTWSRAQAYYQAVTGKKVIGWTGQANWAAPAHQDVVTAVFYPPHAGEWAC